MKKQICIFLAIIMLSAMITGCGNGGAEVDGNLYITEPEQSTTFDITDETIGETEDTTETATEETTAGTTAKTAVKKPATTKPPTKTTQPKGDSKPKPTPAPTTVTELQESGTSAETEAATPAPETTLAQKPEAADALVDKNFEFYDDAGDLLIELELHNPTVFDYSNLQFEIGFFDERENEIGYLYFNSENILKSGSTETYRFSVAGDHPYLTNAYYIAFTDVNEV